MVAAERTASPFSSKNLRRVSMAGIITVGSMLALSGDAPHPRIPQEGMTSPGMTQLYGRETGRQSVFRRASDVDVSHHGRRVVSIPAGEFTATTTRATGLGMTTGSETRFPWVGLGVLTGIPIALSAVGIAHDRESRFRGFKRGGLTGLAIDASLACAFSTPTPTPSPEVAQVPRTEAAQFMDVTPDEMRSSLTAWIEAGSVLPDGYMLADTNGNGTIDFLQLPNPVGVLNSDGTLVGSVHLIQGEAVDPSGAPAVFSFLVWDDGVHGARALASRNATVSGDGTFIRSELVDANGIFAAFQESSTTAGESLVIKVRQENPPGSGTIYEIPYTLRVPTGDTFNNYVNNVQFANSVEVAMTSTPAIPTETPMPTEAPRLPSIDASASWEMQDKSALTAEQIAAIDAVLLSPWTATLEQKAVYNELRAEGIAQQTGDRSFAEPMPTGEAARIAESNRRIGAYVEWAHANGQFVLNLPLPLSWRLDNLADVTNYPADNNSDTSHHIEGFGDRQQEWDGRTGVGILQNMTDEWINLIIKGFENVGNRSRDNIYGEPILFVYPNYADAVGDAMVMVPKAGIPHDQAMDMILRVYRDGRPRYVFYHMQFTDRTIGKNDASCIQRKASPTLFCPEGTLIPSMTVSRWLDPQRQIRVPYTPQVWQDMMKRWHELGYVHPMRVRLEPLADQRGPKTTTFIDGSPIIDNIVVPPLFPEDFFGN